MRTTADVLVYVDTSALVKLVVAEAETTALVAALTGSELVTSALVRTELRRAVLRLGLEDGSARADEVLARVAQLLIDDDVLDRAGALPPPAMRSLDALHVAAAVGLGDRLDGLVTYDVRMSAAARDFGLSVSSPGAGSR